MQVASSHGADDSHKPTRTVSQRILKISYSRGGSDGLHHRKWRYLQVKKCPSTYRPSTHPAGPRRHHDNRYHHHTDRRRLEHRPVWRLWRQDYMYSWGSGAVLLGPEFSSPVRRVSVHASATRIHFRLTSRDQGAIQDTRQCVWGLDHSVLLLPSGCMSDDKRDEAQDEDTDLPCVHSPRMLLKKHWTRLVFL